MQHLKDFDELRNKINLFNFMFLNDLVNEHDKKNWSDYLDPIVKKLYKMDYLHFIKTYSIKEICVPGSYEKYYNLFRFILKTFDVLLSLPTVNDIYCCCKDIVDTFEMFFKNNGFHIQKHKKVDNNLIYYEYEIIPNI